MSKQFQTRLLVVLVCGAVLFLLFFFPATPHVARPSQQSQPAENLETASTQLLWESLSHQFLTNVQH